METSAKASIHVEEAFFTLARDIKTKMEKKLVSLLFSGRMRGSRFQFRNFDWFTGVIPQIRETVDAFNEACEATFHIAC
jgi:hypothetical protein